jgi:hypothetical protein
MRSAVYAWVLVLTPLAPIVGRGTTAQEPPVAAATAKTLTVELTSGRSVAGQVDVATDETHLVLRIARPGIQLKRSIAWQRIGKAMFAGQVIEQARLREVAATLKTAAPRPKFVAPSIPEDAAVTPPVTQAQVAYVTFDARLANWDGDVETDGILIDVFPVDAAGYLAPASGILEIELFAQQRRDFQDAPQSGGRTVERVERWTRQVEAGQFGANGVRLKLPFGAVHPEFDQDWLSMGLVHVKFVAPGHGVFEDSRDAVRIRPFAPNRDYLDTHTGRRFLPTEGVGRRD